MSIIRAIVTLPYFSGVPEDAATNTFHFSTVATPDSTALANINLRLVAFYDSVDAYMSGVISTSLCNVKYYDLADPTPRTPIATYGLGTRSWGASGQPEEVAVCISYTAAAVSGEPAARRRGRIYIGPLAAGAVSTGSSSSFASVNVVARTAFANAAAALADQDAPALWSVYSPTDGIARKIVSGWVDNSFDTQRRRGRLATVRDAWTGVP